MQPVSPLVAHWQELWYRLAYIGLSWCLGFCVCLWKAHLFLYALATPLAHYGPSRFMFTHLADYKSLYIQETARCPECGGGNRKLIHVLN